MQAPEPDLYGTDDLLRVMRARIRRATTLAVRDRREARNWQRAEVVATHA